MVDGVVFVVIVCVYYVIQLQAQTLQTPVAIKGSAAIMAISSLHNTADVWRILSLAWKACRAAAFRVLLFVGECTLIAKGGALLAVPLGVVLDVLVGRCACRGSAWTDPCCGAWSGQAPCLL